MIGDETGARLVERTVLQKFDGDPLPENEIQRVHIQDGEIVMVEEIENGEVVSTREKVE